MNALPPVDLSMSRAEERAFKRGFDAGLEHQKKAAPAPKAKQYRDEAVVARALGANLAAEVRALLGEYARDGKLSIARITSVSEAARLVTP